MADISQYAQLLTVQAIYRNYEERREPAHRPHLGGSQIGHPCDRYLWLQFRWADHPKFDGRMLRLFDHGNVEETRLVRDLRNIGVTVYDVDPDTGKQFNFTAFGGHFACNLDGVGHGLPESSKWHMLEFKTASAKNFAKLKSAGLKKWNPQYWAQVIVGMELADLPRALHLTTCKDTDEIYGERVRAESKEAERLLNRAERVIFSESPLDRVSDRPDWFACKFCAMHSICHGDRVAEVNCRTCVHSTPERDGTWSCREHERTLSVDDQRAGCKSHLMRPDLVPYAEAVDSGPGFVEYRTKDGSKFWNCEEGVRHPGEHRYYSREMRAATGTLPLPPDIEALRQAFDARIDG